MANLLYIIATPNSEEESSSRKIGDSFVRKYKKEHPNDIVDTIDLFSDSLQLIDGKYVTARTKLYSGKPERLTKEESLSVEGVASVVDNFMKYDKYVIASPMWNFGVPYILKRYIDSIVITGKTFKYTDKGPVGLLSGKKLLHIQSSGGIYSHGDFSKYDFSSTYIKSILGFIGITDITTLFIEGVDILPEKKPLIISAALEKAERLAESF
ncbi:MAG: NAD(P)H-dependent oxidoreductase [Oligoflexales bacterium]|nr:NAD(P)H-dependent oxidoreductase [Oligoflexales bacterium]